MKNTITDGKSCPVHTNSTCPYTRQSHVIVNFEDPSFTNNPELKFQELRNSNSIHQITLDDNFPIWLISTYDDAVSVLRDSRFIKSPDNLRRHNHEASKGKTKRNSPTYILRRLHMLANDPPQHTRLRNFAQKVFTKKVFSELQLKIQQITNELIDNIERKKEFDLIDDFAYPLPIIIIADLLGLPNEDREKLRNWSDILIEVQITEKNKQLIDETSEAFTAYLKKIFALRRKNPGEDIISAFLKLEETNDHMSENELYSMIYLLILAGHETTVNLIGNGIHALLSHPEQLHLLKNNPHLIHSAIEEMLRYNGPMLASTMRLAAEDIHMKGATIKKGDGILILFSSANQDETKFDDSLRFDITRKSNKHLAFGHGIHFCIGAPLARLECEIAINTILKRLPDRKSVV